METVELTELRDRLEELIQRFENGEEFILTNAGQWVALLSAPPECSEPLASEEVALKQAALEAAIGDMVARRHEFGLAVPESVIERYEAVRQEQP